MTVTGLDSQIEIVNFDNSMQWPDAQLHEDLRLANRQVSANLCGPFFGSWLSALAKAQGPRVSVQGAKGRGLRAWPLPPSHIPCVSGLVSCKPEIVNPQRA